MSRVYDLNLQFKTTKIIYNVTVIYEHFVTIIENCLHIHLNTLSSSSFNLVLFLSNTTNALNFFLRIHDDDQGCQVKSFLISSPESSCVIGEKFTGNLENLKINQDEFLPRK